MKNRNSTSSVANVLRKFNNYCFVQLLTKVSTYIEHFIYKLNYAVERLCATFNLKLELIKLVDLKLFRCREYRWFQVRFRFLQYGTVILTL